MDLGGCRATFPVPGRSAEPHLNVAEHGRSIAQVWISATFAITQTIAAVGFPVFIFALIPVRALLMPASHALELGILDAPTASPSSWRTSARVRAATRSPRTRGMPAARARAVASWLVVPRPRGARSGSLKRGGGAFSRKGCLALRAKG
ncbi:hypothetical protein NUW58_g6471 [Xylaria curta]|uniref:Uncharacterized protein n=1 Tax=Xylaria curta TaxID=42375 RepID=A0ACC1NVE8_9PEZI|nr:hypothetical protein NUW58_g6471 [Xylaria curta]